MNWKQAEQEGQEWRGSKNVESEGNGRGKSANRLRRGFVLNYGVRTLFSYKPQFIAHFKRRYITNFQHAINSK
jgi:hypothetical protein